jgi:hypothetical protein
MAKKVLKKAQKGTSVKSTSPGGTYFAFKNGRVGRTYPSGPYESIDTTGYSKGKKEFDLIKSYSGYKPLSEKVQRKDVPSVISNLKKGATRTEVYKKKSGVVKTKKKK